MALFGKVSTIRTKIMEAVEPKIAQAEELYEDRAIQAQEAFNRAMDLAETEAVEFVTSKLK